MEWDEAIAAGAKIIETQESYQRMLGELASSVATEHGPSALEDFSRDMKETYGFTRSASTLRNYRWVWETTSELNLPQDIAYRALQLISSSGRPEYWAKRILAEGLSSPQIFRLLTKEKGIFKRKVVCPHCKKAFEIERR